MSLAEMLGSIKTSYQHAKTCVKMSYDLSKRFFDELDEREGTEKQREEMANLLLDRYENELERIASAPSDNAFVYLGIAFSIASNPKKAYEIGSFIRREQDK